MRTLQKSCIVLSLMTFLVSGCAESSEPTQPADQVQEPGTQEPGTQNPGTQNPGTEANPYLCQLEQPFPYPSGVSYVGLHANRENNDYIDCQTAPAYELEWHSLKGHGVGQPNTFSPDGKVTYITSTHPDPDGCTIHAVSAEDGSVL